MKTLTEFSGFSLQDIGKTRAQLISESKTPEEISAALTEQFKVEGEKLQLLLSALDAIDNKVTDLKRVVVGTLAEGEKLPPKAVQKEDKVFVAEYFPPMNRPGGKGKFNGKGGPRDGKRGGGRGGRGGRDGRKGGGGRGRNDRGDRNNEQRAAGGPNGGAGGGAPGEKGGENPRFRRRPPRGPRKPPPPLTGDAAKIKIKPLNPASAAATAAPAAETSGSGSEGGNTSS